MANAVSGIRLILLIVSRSLSDAPSGVATVVKSGIQQDPEACRVGHARLVEALILLVLAEGRAQFRRVVIGDRLVAHRRSRGRDTRGSEIAARMASANGEAVARLAAMPRLANPFRWDCVFETERAMYRFDVGLMGDASVDDTVRYAKPEGELKEAFDEIAQQRPVRIFLGFARFPVAQLEDPGCTTQTLVQLADLRYTEPGQSRGSFTLDVPVDCPNEQLGR